jgi:hypothetical protein
MSPRISKPYDIQREIAHDLETSSMGDLFNMQSVTRTGCGGISFHARMSVENMRVAYQVWMNGHCDEAVSDSSQATNVASRDLGEREGLARFLIRNPSRWG